MNKLKQFWSNPVRRQVFHEQATGVAELATRTIVSPHDRAWFDRPLARTRSAPETEPFLSTQKPSKNIQR